MMECPDDYSIIGHDPGQDNGVYVPKDDNNTGVYFCVCGCFKFEVYMPQMYHTNVRCCDCGRETTVHSG